MVIYTTMFFLIFLLYIISRNTKKTDKVFLTTSGILLVAILGSRHNWYSFSDEGMYYLLYKSYIGVPFESVASIIFEERDFGYFLLNWALAQIIPWPQFILYFTTGLFVFSTFYFIYKNSDNALCSLMTLFGSGVLTFYMSALRQALAFSCCLIAFELLKKTENGKNKLLRNILGYVIYAIGITMHRSAIVFIIPLVFEWIKSDKVKAALTAIGSAVLILFRDKIFEAGNELFEKNYGTGNHLSSTGAIIQIVLLSAPILLFFIWKLKNRGRSLQNSANQNNILFMLILGIILYALRSFSLVIERVAFFFTVAACPLYPNAIEKTVNKRSKQIGYYAAIFLSMLLFLWRIKTGIRGGVFTFFWENV